jgi:hypothetical protein
MNEKLRSDKYKEKPFWTELLGRPVEQLWSDYAESIKADGALLPEAPIEARTGKEDDEEMVMVEREDACEHEKAITRTSPVEPTPDPV